MASAEVAGTHEVVARAPSLNCPNIIHIGDGLSVKRFAWNFYDFMGFPINGAPDTLGVLTHARLLMHALVNNAKSFAYGEHVYGEIFSVLVVIHCFVDAPALWARYVDLLAGDYIAHGGLNTDIDAMAMYLTQITTPTYHPRFAYVCSQAELLAY